MDRYLPRPLKLHRRNAQARLAKCAGCTARGGVVDFSSNPLLERETWGAGCKRCRDGRPRNPAPDLKDRMWNEATRRKKRSTDRGADRCNDRNMRRIRCYVTPNW